MSTVFNFTFVPWFRSVAPYIHMHRGKTFVVGLPGEGIAAGKLPHIAQDLALKRVMLLDKLFGDQDHCLRTFARAA